MLMNTLAGMIVNRIEAEHLAYEQKFCFGVRVEPKSRRATDKAVSRVLAFEVMLSRSPGRQAPEYSLRIDDRTLPINVDARGLKAVVLGTFLQACMVDLGEDEEWFDVRLREADDYETTRAPDQLGRLYCVK